MTDTILLVFSLALFVLAALNVKSPWLNLTAAGLACFIATLLF